MADEQLRIVIDALNKTSDDLKKIQADLKGMDETTRKADKSSKNFGETWAGVLTGLNAGIQIAQQAAAAMKQVYDTAREGAELEMLATRFDNLSASIGTTSDALLTDLRSATRGLVSDAELMASAADFMGLGLASTHDEAVRLASVAGALNMDMNQLVLTLTNKTTMRFDALGVAVTGFDDKVKKLTASGKDADKAFTEAFLEQAEEQIEKVGHAADTSMGAFMQFEAAIKNTTDAMKLQIIESGIIQDVLLGVADHLNNAVSFQEAWTKAIEAGIATEDEYKAIQYAVQHGFMDIAEATADATQRVADLTTGISTFEGGIIRTSIPIQTFTDGLEDVTAEADIAGAAMKGYNDQLLFSIASQGLSADEAYGLAEAMGLIDNRTVYATEQTAIWRDALDNGLITLSTYEGLVAGLADNLSRITDRNATITLNYKQVGDPDATYSWDVLGDRPIGGPVSAGSPYLWQEYGYRGEMMVPSQDGYVLSRADAKRIVSEAVAGGGSGATYIGPSAEDIARAVRDAILTAGIM